MRVVPRRLFAVLLFALPILIVIMVVVMGGYLLLDSATDNVGAIVLRWIGTGLLVLIVSDVILLTAACAIEQYSRQDPPSDSDS